LKGSAEIKSLEEVRRFQNEIFDKSYSGGPFTGVVAELSYKKRIDFALRFMPKSGLVLDFGCGDGTVAKGVLVKARKVIAIDISEQAIEVAKRFNSHSNIEYFQVAIEDFTWRDKFDTVLMFEIIEHLFDPQSVFHKVADLLKEEGTLVLSTPNFMRLNRRIKQLYGIRQIRKIMGKDLSRIGCDHLREYTYKEVKDILDKAGFEVLRYEGIILWTNTIGGDLLRSVNWIQRLNFYLGSLFPKVAGHIYLAARKKSYEIFKGIGDKGW